MEKHVEIKLNLLQNKFDEKFPEELDGYMSPQTFSLRISSINGVLISSGLKPLSETRLARILFWSFMAGVIVIIATALAFTPILQGRPDIPPGIQWSATVAAIILLLCAALISEIYIDKRQSKFERAVNQACAELTELDSPDIEYSLKKYRTEAPRLNPDGSYTSEGPWTYAILLRFSDIPPLPIYVPPVSTPPPIYNPDLPSTSTAQTTRASPPEYSCVIPTSPDRR
ncbi:uncharacterized protein VTP21DRAFT_5682 [Calcarisporiella thermophila]|uniref:uncharacterized protein n=1 Tax=Calcarisporiella thermophila TaxID=911321 RepID=UPI003743F1DE